MHVGFVLSAMATFDNGLEALRRYREDAFTDADVTACTGCSERSIRQLIKVGAVRTRSEERGAGHIRKFDAATFKRLAVAAALNRAGFSLALSGQLAYLLPSDQLLYERYDPINVLFDTSLSVDPNTGLPPRLEAPRFDWFDPDKPATADPKNDWLLEIYDGRFVAQVAQEGRLKHVYGDLRKAGTEFVSWWPFHAQLNSFPSLDTDTDTSPKWEGRRLWADRIDPKFLNFHFERHDTDDDPLMYEGYAAAQRPIFKTSINITLAIRLALRRYLGLTLRYMPSVSTRAAISSHHRRTSWRRPIQHPQTGGCDDDDHTKNAAQKEHDCADKSSSANLEFTLSSWPRISAARTPIQAGKEWQPRRRAE
jgi:hypothetical protein